MTKLTGKERTPKACRTKWAQVEKEFEEGYKLFLYYLQRFCIAIRRE